MRFARAALFVAARLLGRHRSQRRVNRGRGGDRNPILSGRQRQTGKAVGGDRTADVEPGHLIKRLDL